MWIERNFFRRSVHIFVFFFSVGIYVPQFDRDQQKWLSQATTTDQLKSAHHLLTVLFD